MLVLHFPKSPKFPKLRIHFFLILHPGLTIAFFALRFP